MSTEDTGAGKGSKHSPRINPPAWFSSPLWDNVGPDRKWKCPECGKNHEKGLYCPNKPNDDTK